MSAEPRHYVIADLLANAIEPWDNLTARELEALGAGIDPDSALTAPVVVAAYSNERGPVLIDGAQRLQWLAGPPRNRTVISADEVRIDPAAVDEESAHRAAVALHVNRRQASPRVKAELARRLQAQFGWSHATIAEVFKVSRPAVSNWLRQLGGADVPEVTGGDGRIYPARGKQAEHEIPAACTVSAALKVLHTEHEAVVQRHLSIRHVRIDRHGSADPESWTVTVPSRSAGAAADLADRLRDQASDLISLASKLEQAQVPD
jgi:predicted transcriptional regulator